MIPPWLTQRRPCGQRGLNVTFRPSRLKIMATGVAISLPLFVYESLIAQTLALSFSTTTKACIARRKSWIPKVFDSALLAGDQLLVFCDEFRYGF